MGGHQHKFKASLIYIGNTSQSRIHSKCEALDYRMRRCLRKTKAKTKTGPSVLVGTGTVHSVMAVSMASVSVSPYDGLCLSAPHSFSSPL